MRRAGDRVAVGGEATSEGEAVLARSGERHGFLGQLEAARRGRGQRQRNRQPGQHVGAPGEHRRVGEGAGGLLEEIDLTLFEEPNLEAGEVGAEPERGARQELGRATGPSELGEGRERPPGAGLVSGEEQRPPESGEGITSGVDGR